MPGGDREAVGHLAVDAERAADVEQDAAAGDVGGDCSATKNASFQKVPLTFKVGEPMAPEVLPGQAFGRRVDTLLTTQRAAPRTAREQNGRRSV